MAFYRLNGPWHIGKAIDVHTLSSTYLGVDEYGHDQFETTRSEMGELIYRLKYKSDRSTIAEIMRLISPLRGIETYDFIIPAPSSKPRAAQPVDLIAQAMSQKYKIPALIGFLAKTTHAELKAIDDPAEREKALQDSIKIAGQQDISQKAVLVVDDLYRSGSTLRACYHALTTIAKAKKVSVLTMTKTRSNR